VARRPRRRRRRHHDRPCVGVDPDTGPYWRDPDSARRRVAGLAARTGVDPVRLAALAEHDEGLFQAFAAELDVVRCERVGEWGHVAEHTALIAERLDLLCFIALRAPWFKESAAEGWEPLRIGRPWETDEPVPEDDIDPAAFAAFAVGPRVR
jgi:hypothetical protein